MVITCSSFPCRIHRLKFLNFVQYSNPRNFVCQSCSFETDLFSHYWEMPFCPNLPPVWDYILKCILAKRDVVFTLITILLVLMLYYCIASSSNPQNCFYYVEKVVFFSWRLWLVCYKIFRTWFYRRSRENVNFLKSSKSTLANFE